MAIFSSNYAYVSPVIKYARYGTKYLSTHQNIYVYGNNKESFNDKVNPDKILVPLGFAIAGNKRNITYKTEENIGLYLKTTTATSQRKKFILLNEVFTVLFGRTNSNIYKNIFPEIAMDIEYINNLIDNTPTTLHDIVQENHNLKLYDIVYLDSEGKYQKAIAEDSNKAIAVGIITNVISNNVFTLMSTGKYDYHHLDFNDTSILYLSDKEPGKLVHYSEITNTVYVPIAIYTNDSIIINIQQGSIGDILAPYEPNKTDFELYTKNELDNLIYQIVNEV